MAISDFVVFCVPNLSFRPLLPPDHSPFSAMGPPSHLCLLLLFISLFGCISFHATQVDAAVQLDPTNNPKLFSGDKGVTRTVADILAERQRKAQHSNNHNQHNNEISHGTHLNNNPNNDGAVVHSGGNGIGVADGDWMVQARIAAAANSRKKPSIVADEGVKLAGGIINDTHSILGPKPRSDVVSSFKSLS